MYNLKILPYKMGSESAKDLSQLLNVMRVRPDGEYVPKLQQKVLNWGSSRTPNWSDIAVRRGVTILNKPSAVNNASNKYEALRILQAAGIRVPEFTTDMAVAQRWLNSNATVVERHELRGNSGEGIRIVTMHDPEMQNYITRAPLYTKFVNKTTEFRVHCFRGEVIDYIEKKKVLAERRDSTFNKYISSINMGWVFSRTDIRDMPEVRQLALRAVTALGLDFGAVDIIYCDGIAYVLEVNSAPGLAGTTLVKYGNAIRRFISQPDLPLSATQSLMDRVSSPTPAASRVESVSRPVVDNSMVTFQLDRQTALKLKTILLGLNL